MARHGSAAQLFQLLSSPAVAPAEAIALAHAAASAAIVAGGWADTRVAEHAAGLRAALPDATCFCAGGTLVPDAAERAAGLEDFTEYRGGPAPTSPAPTRAERLADALGRDTVRVECTSTTITEQAANVAGELEPGTDTLLVVASAYQRAGMRLALSASAPTARVVCVDSANGSDAASDTAWFSSQGRALPALMLAEAARLQSAHPGPEHAVFMGQLTDAAKSLDDSINADAATLAAAVAARGVKCVCWDMDRTFMAAHSRGHMTPWLLPAFAPRVSPDFVRLSRALQSTECAQAVATHSDFAEHSAQRPEGEYIIGEPLVRRVGEESYPTLLQWPIVAYNPRARALKAAAAAAAGGGGKPVAAAAGGGTAEDEDGWEGRGDSEEDKDKRYHLRAIADAVGCDVKDCMLIDDMPGTCPVPHSVSLRLSGTVLSAAAAQPRPLLTRLCCVALNPVQRTSTRPTRMARTACLFSSRARGSGSRISRRGCTTALCDTTTLALCSAPSSQLTRPAHSPHCALHHASTRVLPGGTTSEAADSTTSYRQNRPSCGHGL